jgi:hypothetical protein
MTLLVAGIALRSCYEATPPAATDHLRARAIRELPNGRVRGERISLTTPPIEVRVAGER